MQTAIKAARGAWLRLLVRELDRIVKRVIWFTCLLTQDRTAASTALKIRRSELYFTDHTLIDNSRLCWKSESRKMTRQPAVRTKRRRANFIPLIAI